MPLPNYDTPEMLRLSQKTLDFKATAGLSAVPDAAKLQECIAMSLTRLQLVFLHLPEKDDERLKFMAGLECEMNEIYFHFGAAHHWQVPVEVHAGVVMCSHYIRSTEFANRDTAALAQFSEDFISTYPPLPDINDYRFENQWWTALAHATFPSSTFVEHQARRQALVDRLDVVAADMQQSIAFVKKLIRIKKSQIVQLRSDCAAEMVLSNPANEDVRHSLRLKINEFLQQKGSARADAWTNTASAQPMNSQATNADPNNFAH